MSADNPTQDPANAPPPRAAFAIHLVWDPNTAPRPTVHLAPVGAGVIYESDVLAAYVMARDEFLQANVARVLTQTAREGQARVE